MDTINDDEGKLTLIKKKAKRQRENERILFFQRPFSILIQRIESSNI